MRDEEVEADQGQTKTGGFLGVFDKSPLSRQAARHVLGYRKHTESSTDNDAALWLRWSILGRVNPLSTWCAIGARFAEKLISRLPEVRFARSKACTAQHFILLSHA